MGGKSGNTNDAKLLQALFAKDRKEPTRLPYEGAPIPQEDTLSKPLAPGAASGAAPVGIGGVTGTQTVNPFMPGQMQSIANQLQNGFGSNGATAQNYMTYMQQLQRPMQLPTYGGQPQQGAPTPAGPIPSPIAPPIAPPRPVTPPPVMTPRGKLDIKAFKDVRPRNRE